MTSPTAEQMMELQKKASAGPWEVGGPYPGTSVITCIDGGSCGWGEAPEPPAYEPICILDQRTEGVPNKQARFNAAFIAAARSFDFSTATANERRVRELEEENKYLKGDKARLIDQHADLRRQVLIGQKRIDTLQSTLQAHARENERLREALERLRASHQATLDQYAANGPQYTSHDSGDEYYEASYVTESAQECLDAIDAAIAPPRQPKEQ